MKRQLHVRITNADYEQLKTLGAEDSEGLANMVRQAIRLYIRSRAGRSSSADDRRSTLNRSIIGTKTVQ